MPSIAPERAETTGLIFDVMRFATHDGPGIRTTVFFKGCPLSCFWCHNPESQSFLPERLHVEERCRHCLDCVAACPEHAIDETDGVVRTSERCVVCGTCADACMAQARQIAGRRYTVRELLAEVERDVVFFDEAGGGVTLSGGEPLSQPAFASAFLIACGDHGIRTAIETCGFAQPQVFRTVAFLADLVLFDLKLVDAEKHRQFTGDSNDLILGNLQALAQSSRPVHVRIPVVPGVNDSDRDIADFMEVLSAARPRKVELLPYHRIGIGKYRRLGLDYRLQDTPEPSAVDIARFRDALASAGLNVTVRGG